MLDALGVEWVQPGDLASLKSDSTKVRFPKVNDRSLTTVQIYACMIPPSAYMARLDDGTYDRQDYYANPSEYYSTFPETVSSSLLFRQILSLTDQVGPYLTGLINGVGWQSGFPRTMTRRDIDQLVESSGGEMRLVAIQDVSCDLKVSDRSFSSILTGRAD
jgi:alpha-aminoadipic semialdehyde synthase